MRKNFNFNFNVSRTTMLTLATIIFRSFLKPVLDRQWAWWMIRRINTRRQTISTAIVA